MCKMWLDFVVSWLSLGTTDLGWNMRFVLAVGANANCITSTNTPVIREDGHLDLERMRRTPKDQPHGL